MYDIDFFKNSNKVKEKITKGFLKKSDAADISLELNTLRKETPYIYNIETTNYCNMKCVMCPRTMYMTRKNIWIDDSLFEKLLGNVKTHNKENLDIFWKWAKDEYNQNMTQQAYYIQRDGFHAPSYR